MESMMTEGPKTLKVHMVTHVTSAQSLEVGDVDGHIASLARFSGLAFYTDGTVGSVSAAMSVFAENLEG
jgi:hypothetical protein